MRDVNDIFITITPLDLQTVTTRKFIVNNKMYSLPSFAVYFRSLVNIIMHY